MLMRCCNMKKEYFDWLCKHFPTYDDIVCNCEHVTKEMVKEFPDLKRVRGLAHVEEPYGLPPTKTPHWWCEDTDGCIVDPTGHQYPTRIIKYEPVDESKGEPRGKCMWCGSLYYDTLNPFCTDECEKKHMNYLNTNKGGNNEF